MSRLRLAGLLVLAAVLFCVGLDLSRTFDGTFFFVFQARDLERARLLLSGNPVFFGPEMTGGGNLPGPLYYFLLAGALALNEDWISTWALMVALAGAGGLAGWYWFRTRLSAAAGWFWLALYSTSYFTQVLLELYLNVSFVLFFAVAALLCLCEFSIAESRERRRGAFALFCLFVSLSLQLHFSLIFLFMGGLVLRPVRGKDLLAGLALFVLPWIPYLAWLAGILPGQEAGLVGRSSEAFPTIVSYVANIAKLPLAATAAHSGRFLEVVPVALLLAWMAAAAFRARLGPREARLAKALLVCALFGLLPFVYFFVAPIGRRYVIPLGLPVMFLATIAFERCRSSSSSLRLFSWGGAGLAIVSMAALLERHATKPPVSDALSTIILVPAAFFLAAGWLGGQPWRRAMPVAFAIAAAAALGLSQRAFVKLGYTNSSHVSGMRYVASMREWSMIWSIVRERTCWTYEEARKRIYYVNHHLEQEPRFGWERVPPQGADCAWAPDGFIVSILKREPGPVVPWLLASNIHADLRRGLTSGAIEVEEPSYARGMLVVPYYVRDKRSFPAYFHDQGEGYLMHGRRAFPEPSTSPAEAGRTADGKFLFRWNECPGRHPFCDAGVVVGLSAEKGDTWKLQAEAKGYVISQTSPWISPNWTESWRRPWVEVRCGKGSERFQLADSIGYEQAYGHQPGFPFDYNNSFVAPFEREWRFRCRGGPRAVTVGREATVVETLKESRVLAPKPLTLELAR